MADECTDVTTTEELSIFFRWVNMDGQPVEHFLDIVPLKATDAKTIYSALVEFMKDKNIQISKLVGMGSMEQLLSLGNTMVCRVS